jgi:hypothetical protein
MKVDVDGKEIKMIEVSKLIELLEVWKNRRFATNYVAISDTGHMCLIEQLRGEYDQFGVIHLDTEKTVVFDEGF